MSSEGRWEIVGKGKKPKAPKSKPNANGAANGTANANGSPKPVAPVDREKESVFNRFIEDEEKPRPKPPAPLLKPARLNLDDFKAGKENNKQPQQAKKKKTTPTETEKPKLMSQGFDSDAKKIKQPELETAIKLSMTHFPQSSSIWLKDIAAYLNHLLPYEAEDPVFNGKPLDYPLCALPVGVRQKLTQLLSKCTIPTIQLFLEHCLDTIVKNNTHHLPTLGYRIMLQLVAIEYPSAALNNIQRFIDTRISVKNRPSLCLSVLWAAKQAGHHNFQTGFLLWYEVLFPLITVKQFTKFVIDSLDGLLKHHEKSLSKATEPQLSEREFFPIFDFVYSPTNGLSANQQSQLRQIYSKLKALVRAGKNSAAVLPALFSSYLSRLTDENTRPSEELRAEIVSTLIGYLSEEPACFAEWRSVYPSSLLQSSVLLEHLVQQQNKLSRKAAREFRETFSYFKQSNLELSQQQKGRNPGLDRCITRCQNMDSKISRSGSLSWKSLGLLLIAVAASIVAYDVQLHGTFQKSITGRVLNDYGLVKAFDDAQAKLNVYYKQVSIWWRKNYPIYYDQLNRTVGPYVRTVWEKVQLGLSAAWEAALPVRQWVGKTVPPLYEQFQTQVVPKVVTASQQALAIVQSYLTDLGLWIQKNVLTGSFSIENIQKILIAYVTKAQQAAGDAIGWVSKRVQT